MPSTYTFILNTRVIQIFLLGDLATWISERFESLTSSHGARWPKFIYSTINGGDQYTCAMYCNLDDNCIYHVFYGGNCYLGDCSVTTQTLPDQGYGSVVYKAGMPSFYFLVRKEYFSVKNQRAM